VTVVNFSSAKAKRAPKPECLGHMPVEHPATKALVAMIDAFDGYVIVRPAQPAPRKSFTTDSTAEGIKLALRLVGYPDAVVRTTDEKFYEIAPGLPSKKKRR
jgi:hypothetical protein